MFQTTTDIPHTTEKVSLPDTSISDAQTTAFPSTHIDSTTSMITTSTMTLLKFISKHHFWELI